MDSTNITLYRVRAYHIDGRVRNVWCFEQKADALGVADVIKAHYNHVYSYKPFVMVREAPAVACESANSLFIEGKHYVLSDATRKMAELMDAVRGAQGDAERVLQVLGESPLLLMPQGKLAQTMRSVFCCLCICFAPGLDPPVHYKYSLM